MLPRQTDRIRHLKELFEQAGKGLSSRDLGEEGRLNKKAQTIDIRMAEIQLSLIAQGSRLLKVSIDQVTNCLEMARYMQFFGRVAFPQTDDFIEQAKLTGKFMEVNCAMLSHDLQETDRTINAHVTYLEGQDIVDERAMDKAMGHLDVYAVEYDRFREIEKRIALYQARMAIGAALFNKEQMPDVGGQSPQAAIAVLQSNTARNVGMSISHNIEYGLSYLAKMQFIHERVIPVLPHLADEWHQESYAAFLKVETVLGRIDTLVELQARNDDLFGPKVG